MSAQIFAPYARGMEGETSPGVDDSSLSSIEALAAQRPRLYLTLVLAGASAGYLLLLACPAGALVSGLLALGNLLDFPALARQWPWLVVQAGAAALFGWASYGLVQLRMPLPQGIDPAPGSALRALVEQLRSSLQSGRIHHVRIIGAPEIRLARTPETVLLPRLINTLQIGLPLMLSASPEDLRALVAQRVGELKYGLRWAPGWAGLLIGAWRQLADALNDGRRPGRLLAHRIVALYVKALESFAGPALRQAQLLAERSALEILDDGQVKAAVTRQALVRQILETVFWPELWSLAKRHPSPPTPMALVAPTVAKHCSPERALPRIAQLMDERRSGIRPTLRERLESLGHRGVDLPPPVARTAAEVYLGSETERLVRALDRDWLAHNLDAWHARHRRGKERIRDGLALLKKAKSGTLSQEESWDFAQMVQRRIKDRRKAKKLFKRLLASDPGHARAQFLAGRYLIDAGDETGARALLRAAELDPGLRSPALRLVARFKDGGHRAEQAL